MTKIHKQPYATADGTGIDYLNSNRCLGKAGGRGEDKGDHEHREDEGSQFIAGIAEGFGFHEGFCSLTPGLPSRNMFHPLAHVKGK